MEYWLTELPLFIYNSDDEARSVARSQYLIVSLLAGDIANKKGDMSCIVSWSIMLIGSAAPPCTLPGNK